MKLFRKTFVIVLSWKGFPKNDRIRRALGDYHFNKDEFNKALYWYTYARSVRINDPIRQERLGFLYEILGDEERMIYHLTNAVRFGNQNALEHFATRFIKQKPELVAKLAREAIHAGDKQAEHLLIGSLEAMNRYDDELLGLLRKYAEEGDAQAQFDLGCCYLEGKGVSQDSARAFLWTLLAAIQRHPTAQNNIGYMYERGICVRQDRQQAFTWFLRAASDGCSLGRENLLEYLSDACAK